MQRGVYAALMTTLALAVCVACAQAENPAAATPAAGDEVVARFGDETITQAEFDGILGYSLLRLENQMYQTKVNALRQHIVDKLVDEAAAAEGVTKEEYLKARLDDQLIEPTEAQIEPVMRQYRSRLPKDEAEARKQVVGYLKQQQRQQLQQRLNDELFAKAGVEILIDAPRANVPVKAHSPSRGPEDATVTLIEYTDFQCPYCSRVQPSIDKVIEVYGDNVRHVFKHLPLAMHKQAQLAAEASLCADDQNLFWDLHDWMFANASKLSRETIEAQAEEIGLDMEVLRACLDGEQHKQDVDADAAEAKSLGITGTPGFLVNGRVLTGAQPYEKFVEVIDQELRAAGIEPPVAEPPAQEAEAEGEAEGGRGDEEAKPDAE